MFQCAGELCGEIKKECGFQMYILLFRCDLQCRHKKFTERLIEQPLYTLDSDSKSRTQLGRTANKQIKNLLIRRRKKQGGQSSHVGWLSQSDAYHLPSVSLH